MTEKEAIHIIWDYHLLHQKPEPADMIWALGSHDLRVADRVAELWHAGLAPLVVMSGGLGNYTKGVFEKPEAVLFAERATALGVPEQAILTESESTNTGENVLFTRRLLADRGVTVTSAIAVQKPFMERRTFATIRNYWPELRVSVTSPQLGFDAYCKGNAPREHIVNQMVGDLQRLMEYPKRGFLIEQPIPPEVHEAYDTLIAAGYTRFLIASA